MSLQVWLPLNGDLHNQGLTNVSITNNGTTVNNNGKLGKAIEFGSSKYIKLNNYASTFLTYSTWSLSVWFKCTAQNTTHSGSALISGGNWNAAANLLNLSLCDFSSDHYTKLIISGSGGWANGYSYNFYLNTWYHVVLTSGNGAMRAYVNGVLIGDSYAAFNPGSLEQTWICIGNGTYNQSFHFYGLMNDVRIYDHCLSPKEVEEIAKGLVLHYKLDNYWLAENLLVNTHFDSRYSQTTGWDTSKNGTLLANSWAGYNSGVANQATVYHAHLKEVNGEYVYEFIKDADNSWLGVSQSGLQSKLTAGTKYTFSWEQYCVSGSNYVNTGLYYYKTGASSASFHLGYAYGNSGRVLGKWQKFTYTFTAPSDADYAKNMTWYVYGAQGGNGTFYTRHFKLEKGDKATPWCPAKTDTLYTAFGYNGTTIYDSSGYSNNGTIVGSLTAAAGSPRYDVATVFDGNTSGIYLNNQGLASIFNQQIFSISFWIKSTGENGARSVYFSAYSPSSGQYMCLEKTAGNVFRYVGSGFDNNGGTTLSDGNWYYICFVKKSNTDKTLYINGTSVLTLTNDDGLTNLSTVWRIGRDSRDGTTSYCGSMSDFRIYATALTPNQIKELYTTSMSIDSSGNVHARELVEL